jgi:hypothetical protein
VSQHHTPEQITEYRVDQAMLQAGDAILESLWREGYEEIGYLPDEAMEMIRQAIRVTIGEQVTA